MFFLVNYLIYVNYCGLGLFYFKFILDMRILIELEFWVFDCLGSKFIEL